MTLCPLIGLLHAQHMKSAHDILLILFIKPPLYYIIFSINPFTTSPISIMTIKFAASSIMPNGSPIHTGNTLDPRRLTDAANAVNKKVNIPNIIVTR